MEMIMDLNEMKADSEKFVIVERFPEIDYVLLKRDTEYQPWIAAWSYDEDNQCWGQGHYFEHLEEAVDWIRYKIQGIHRNKIEEIATQLIDYVNETADIDEVLDDYGIDLDYSEREFFCLDETED